MNRHLPSHLAANFPATRPPSHRLGPAIITTCVLARTLANFCSLAPVENQRASSAQTATTGVTCGRPSARTVETQWL